MRKFLSLKTSPMIS